MECRREICEGTGEADRRTKAIEFVLRYPATCHRVIHSSYKMKFIFSEFLNFLKSIEHVAAHKHRFSVHLQEYAVHNREVSRSLK